MKSNPGALRSALFLFSISFYLTLFSQLYNTRSQFSRNVSTVAVNRHLSSFTSSLLVSNFSRLPLSISDTTKKKDRDGDGIVDSLDKCPDEKGSIQYDGCPVPDSDNDGVSDDNDACPTIPGTVKYKGCPIPDSDGDKINDEDDKCPHQAGVARYAGCPVGDRDRDGVNDDDDKCIDVPGSINNAGCPENKKASLQPSREKRKRKDYSFNFITTCSLRSSCLSYLRYTSSEQDMPSHLFSNNFSFYQSSFYWLLLRIAKS